MLIFKVYKLVANVIEIKGMGVLLLDTGKSSLSVFTILKYPETYLIADDYTYIITQSFNYPVKDLNLLNLYATATQKVPIGKLRNNLLTLSPSTGLEDPYVEENKFLEENFNIKYVREEKRYLGEITEEELKKVWIDKLRDTLRKTSHYIDTIAQRVAHKNIVEIKYVFFLQTKKDIGTLISFTNTLLNRLKIDDSEYIKKIREFIIDFYLKLKEDKIIEITNFSDPKKNILLNFFRITSGGVGENWLPFIEGNNHLRLFVMYSYDNLIEKVEKLYNTIEKINPVPIRDPKEERLNKTSKEALEEYFDI